MIALICFLLASLTAPFKSKSRLEAENAALRHQLAVLRRKVRGRIELANGDRLFLIQLYRWFPSVLRDGVYGAAVTRRLRAMGIRDKPIAAGPPWQNGFAERLIGSIRRECTDHIIALGERHLRRVLRSYARYYKEMRTHRSLDKDSPVSRSVQRIGCIISHALLGGLHHQYVRVRRSQTQA